MTRPRAAVLTAALAVLTLLVSGCGVISVESGDGGRPAIDSADLTELAQDERTAVNITDRFWREVFPETFGRSYRSPDVQGGYRGRGGPTCGGQPSVPNNAFYCPSEDFLAWDENLMAAGYNQIGDAWVYLIIAHEWGHAIQARLQRDQVSVAAELQADCLAGATLFGAAERGLVTIERGDTEELQQTLVAVADDFPWTEESDHGNAQQRINAFNTGAQEGVRACVS